MSDKDTNYARTAANKARRKKLREEKIERGKAKKSHKRMMAKAINKAEGRTP